MKLYIKNKMVSLGGASKVLDENENPKFNVKGKVFSITKKKKICDLEGNVLYRVRNKFWHFSWNRYAFIDDEEGNRVAKLKLKFGFSKKFFIQGYKDEISVEGNFIGLNFTIYKNGEVIGSLSKKYLSLVDTFILDIGNEEDAAFLTAIVIGIDNIYDKKMEAISD